MRSDLMNNLPLRVRLGMRLCTACSKKHYKKTDRSKLTGITISDGNCSICNKKTWLIPVRDLEHAIGNEDVMWD